ncbi:MAG TPA: hypothetical protein VG406_14790 [Isosphaeraceae bacterium]|jgi:hypothetical protein|nr:hypothetical protein [Isosphaeraceae bacterium]
MEATTNEDDVIRAVRAARDEYCRTFGYDLEAIVRDLQEQARAEGRRVVRLPPRPPVQAGRSRARDHLGIGPAQGGKGHFTVS